MDDIKIFLLALLLTLLIASSAMALRDGTVIVKVGDGTYASGVEIQKDGRIVVAGDIGTKVTGIHSRSSRYPSDLVLFRLTANGQLDENFG